MNVLLVEDNPLDTRRVQMLLAQVRGQQFVVRHVFQLMDAFDAIAAERPDVVLLDLGLPDSDSLETMRRFREHAPELPVVVLTGAEEGKVGLDVVRLGAQDFLSKESLTSQVMVRSMSYAVERKRLEKEQARLLHELQAALAEVERLSGCLPICSSCKKIRDDTGQWEQVEVYIARHSEAEFTHGVCPECAAKFYAALPRRVK